MIRKLLPEKLKRQFRMLRSIIGALYYGNPAKKLKIIGVTGTSGKSTTASMIYHILKEMGLNVGIISTVGARTKNQIMDTGFHVTTPDPIQLQKILKLMVDQGIEYIVLESSSHALAQGRLGRIKFDFAVYTNIKRDHLDWHKTWESYAASKARLINSLKQNGTIIVNRDDEESYQFLNSYAKLRGKDKNLIIYSKNELQSITVEKTGLKFVYSGQLFEVPVIGEYNLENLLASINVATNLKLNLENTAEALKSFSGVKGRMEIMQKEPFMAIVDFAHNTDSLENSLKTVRNLMEKNSKLIVVFGSAGLRDKEKRFTMGKAAGELSDIVIATSEDPRTESLFEINSEIVRGAEESGAKLVARFANNEEYISKHKEFLNEKGKQVFAFDEESVNSRYDAIDFAVKLAKEGDIVIAEGKGHELSLCFGKIEYPFTDQDAMEKALKNNTKD